MFVTIGILILGACWVLHGLGKARQNYLNGFEGHARRREEEEFFGNQNKTQSDEPMRKKEISCCP